MKNIGMNLLAIVGIVLVLIIASFVITAFLALLAIALTVLLLWWGTGQKIVVKQDGKRIGTLRWFTFTKLR